MLSYDNLSQISETVSDALCRLSTGGGFATRKLYSDDEEASFSGKRLVITNGIPNIIERDDLRDRAITITLQSLSKITDEKSYWKSFEEIRPRIFGATLDVIVSILKNLADTTLKSSTRMADFALWITAGEPALGWKPGSFMEAYANNKNESIILGLESSLLVTPLIKLLNDGEWEGIATQLLECLEEDISDSTKKSKLWPKGANKLSGELRRLAPALRICRGITVEFHPPTAQKRLITIKKIDQPIVTSVIQGGNSLSSKGNEHDDSDDNDGISGDLSFLNQPF